jgi:putative transcriptional regulator
MGNQVIKTLKNHLLVANSSLNGTPFQRSVVYVTRNDRSGSRGFIINQPLARPVEGPSSALERMMAESFYGITFRTTPKVLDGGTTEPDRVFAIHAPWYHCPHTVDISPLACLSTPEDIAPAMEADLVPYHANLCYGYTAWDQGELEEKLHGSDWFVIPATEELLFRTAPEDRYGLATRGLGLNAINFTGIVGRA